MKITKEQARKFLVHYHHFQTENKLNTKEDIINFVKKAGCIQYDPIDIVGNNPNLVLQSRVKNYKSFMLQELLYEDRALIDGWDKCMSIYSIEDYPYLKRHSDWRHDYMVKKLEGKTEFYPHVLEEIKIKGPMSSKDLQLNEKLMGPWGRSTRLSNALLEALYFKGELIVYNRNKNIRTFDLITNHISPDILNEEINMNKEQWIDYNVLRRIKSVGILWNKNGLAYIGFKMSSKERSESFNRLTDENKIVKINVIDSKFDFYMCHENLDLLNKVVEGYKVEKECVFLAPLDNMIWDRGMIKEIFNFDYIWEIYKPAKDRKYGHYTLPILYGDKFIGRFQPKFDKKTKCLEIKDWYFEDNIRITKTMIKAINNTIKKFMKYLNAKELVISSESLKGFIGS